MGFQHITNSRLELKKGVGIGAYDKKHEIPSLRLVVSLGIIQASTTGFRKPTKATNSARFGWRADDPNCSASSRLLTEKDEVLIRKE